MARVTQSENSRGNDIAPCFEATLWDSANKPRGNPDAAEDNHVLLGKS